MTHPVKISLSILWKVKIDDHINSLHVNTSGKQICNRSTNDVLVNIGSIIAKGLTNSYKL